MKKYIIGTFSVALLSILSAAIPVSASIIPCTNITSTLSLGSTDTGGSTQVIMLQNYMVNLSFLYETPNGYFDNQTQAAVKEFQTANSITASGQVDTATAAKIKLLTCPQTATITTPIQTATVSNLVLSPKGGENLGIGGSYKIAWTNQPNTSYDILLAGVDNNTNGYIASNLYQVGSFAWRVGDITSASNPYHHLVSSGSYRIDVRTYIAGGTVTDNYSGIIQIASSPLAISEIFPASVPADGITSVVLYGAGFGTQPAIYLDGSQNNDITPEYVSPDGKVIVFTIPVAVSSGKHTVQIISNPSSGASSASNNVDLTVTPINSNADSYTTSSSQPTVSQSSATSATTVSNASYSFNNYLYMGMTASGQSDPDVTALQKRLAKDSLYSGPITGYFGPLTKSAVKAYQKKNGLSAIGVVGPSTRNLLNEGI